MCVRVNILYQLRVRRECRVGSAHLVASPAMEITKSAGQEYSGAIDVSRSSQSVRIGEDGFYLS